MGAHCGLGSRRKVGGSVGQVRTIDGVALVASRAPRRARCGLGSVLQFLVALCRARVSSIIAAVIRGVQQGSYFDLDAVATLSTVILLNL